MRRAVCVFFVLLAPWGADAQEEPQGVWKHQIGFPDEPFQSWTSPPYVKFTIITRDGYDPNLVYYQDSSQYEYHFDFALEHLEPFLGMTLKEFDLATLHVAGQQAVLGAVILPPWHDPPFHEYGIQLARTDPYTPEETVRFFNQIKASVVADPNVRAYYFPTFEQYPVAQQNREWFESRGVLLGSTAQWAEGNASYSQGWTLGTLKFVSGGDIQRAYTAGELTPDDVLLTDGVPAEMPSLAGIMTLSPSTPNSHVAILARSQGVPFAHVAMEDDAVRARSLVGRGVYLAVTEPEFGQGCSVKLSDVTSLGDAERTSLLSLKDAPPLVIQPMASRGRLWADTNDLRPADIRFFGGKAANFGVLRRAFPDDSPWAMAFSFDLWNAFLDQRLSATAGGRTLREEIDRRLAKHTAWPPADLQALAGDLASVRDLFKDTQTTGFGPSGAAVLNALRDFGFDASRNIRFRSSTNVEDSDQFTGAGLYDSFSGCLADDLDDDTAGPCACDPVEKNERGVLRAIRKVFASFYNDNAFLERRKHRVNEAEVGMALLVHHSFPDEIELANGVATLEKANGPDWSASVVSQKGAVSVTTPPMDGALRPNQRLEELDATPAPAPDDLAEWGGAIVYSSGRELRDVKNGSVLRTFDAPITCLGAGGSALAIGLSGSGLHLLHADGSIAQVNSGKLRNPTAVAFAGDDIVACEGSTKRAPDEWKRDLMEAGYAGPGTGSVWIFGRDRSGRRLANGLRYPNGIIAGAQGTIVVSESWSHRLVAVDPRGGLVRVVLPDLPGYPARMACASDGGVWLSIFAPRSQLIEFVLREPAYRRRMMAEINPDYWIAPALANSRSFLEPLQGGGVKQMGVLKPWAPSRSYGLVVKLDAAWQPVLSLHSRADGTRHGTTSVLEMEGNLYIASKGGDAILSVPVEELIET